ncbi:hypothetical protein [Peribacillus muralis]|uniref:hypothetical protein n=1 Tax=Peribacillus muralis TaxID=264697 RepID=UPI003D037C0B
MASKRAELASKGAELASKHAKLASKEAKLVSDAQLWVCKLRNHDGYAPIHE